MKMVIHQTDYLIFLIVIISIIMIIRSQQSGQLSEFLRKIFYRPINMVAGLILLVYVVIGFLDTLHFKPKDENLLQNGSVVSVLDSLLKPISTKS